MSEKVKCNFYAFLSVFLWAAAFPLTKVAGGFFSPYCLGLIRCTVAACTLLIIGKFLHMRKPFCRKDLILLALAGIFGFALYLLFFNTGIQTITSATSSVIIASTPVMTAIAAFRLYQEKIRAAGWLSILMAFIGVIILLFWNGVFSINTGILWTLAAAIVFCIYNLLNRKLSATGYSPVEIVTYGMISGALMLVFCLPQTLTEISQADISAILIAVCLGLLPSATSYVLWSKALELADKTNEVTNYMFITPLLSAIMGFMILREFPDTGTFLGGFIIIASVVLFGLKGK